MPDFQLLFFLSRKIKLSYFKNVRKAKKKSIQIKIDLANLGYKMNTFMVKISLKSFIDY